MLELKNYEHPYYCADSNYYSNEASQNFPTFNAFLENFGFEDTDIDMNLIFRRDIEKYDDKEFFHLKLYMIHQRKGRFCPIFVEKIVQEDMENIEKRLTPHKNKLVELWNPFM